MLNNKNEIKLIKFSSVMLIKVYSFMVFMSKNGLKSWIVCLFAPPAQGRYCPILVGFAEGITQGAMDRGELREKRTRYKNIFWSFYYISWLHSHLFLILHVSHLCVFRNASCCREFLLLFGDHALGRCSDGRVHANPGVFMMLLLVVVYFANLTESAFQFSTKTVVISA